jgi:hypothetical protein
MVALSKQKTSNWHPPLRLVRDDDPVAEAGHPSERRVSPRRETTVTVMGRRLDHSVPARRQPVLTMNLRDLSAGGLSGITPTPLAAGERIAVSFPQQGMRMGWGACGRVLRCEPAGNGYQVAVEFESLPTAA